MLSCTKISTLAVVALTASAGAIGCGSGDSDDGGSASSGKGGPALSKAQATIREAKSIPEFTLKAPAFDASKAKGKKLFLIPISSSNPFTASIDAEIKKLAPQVGIKVTEFRNQGSPTEWGRGIDQAIAQDADVIAMVGGGDPALVLPQIKRAKKAGIPTIVSHYFNAGEIPPKVKQEVAGFVMGPFHDAGKLMANYAFTETDGRPHPLIITANEAAPSKGMVKAIEAELRSLCPDCESKTINVPVVDWATKMQGEVRSALLANPKVNFILPLYDSMAPGAAAGVTGSNRKAPIATFNGTASVLKLVQDGDAVQMDVGENINWIAYATTDLALRLMSGEEPLPQTNNNAALPLRIFDDSNVGETGKPPASDKGYGDAYVSGYEKLWGLNK